MIHLIPCLLLFFEGPLSFYLSLTLCSLKLSLSFLTHWHTFLNWWPTFTTLGFRHSLLWPPAYALRLYLSLSHSHSSSSSYTLTLIFTRLFLCMCCCLITCMLFCYFPPCFPHAIVSVSARVFPQCKPLFHLCMSHPSLFSVCAPRALRFQSTLVWVEHWTRMTFQTLKLLWGLFKIDCKLGFKKVIFLWVHDEPQFTVIKCLRLKEWRN